MTDIICGDVLAVLKNRFAAESVQCVVTSPPYWGLRDYGVPDQIGLEPTPDAYVAKMVEVFREVRRVLKADGTLWLNLGDSYVNSGHACPVRNIARAGMKLAAQPWKSMAGMKPKDLVGIPWRVAFALQADGWYLRSDIIWAKPNPMPESVTDRPTKAHEYIFLMSKRERYHFDSAAISEPVSDEEYRTNGKIRPTAEGGKGFEIRGGLHNQEGGREWRNKRTVWTINSQPYPDAHFATFPPKLIEPCILAGSRAGDVVLDPFCGSGTTLAVAKHFGRQGVGIELNPEYVKLAEDRIGQMSEALPF